MTSTGLFPCEKGADDSPDLANGNKENEVADCTEEGPPLAKPGPSALPQLVIRPVIRSIANISSFSMSHYGREFRFY